MKSLVLVASGLFLSCFFVTVVGQTFSDRNSKEYKEQIKRILDGTYTKSPLGYLLPLEAK